MSHNHEDGVMETIRSYWVVYLPYQEFSQTGCRLWTGMLVGKKSEGSRGGKQGRRVHVTSAKSVSGENQVHVKLQTSPDDVWLQSYRLACRGRCCPLVQPLGCGV